METKEYKYKNIYKNVNLRKHLEKIMSVIDTKNYDAVFEMCKLLLEYIFMKNAKNLNVYSENYSIIDFIEENKDYKLKEYYIPINSLYNELLDKKANKLDVLFLLSQIDCIVEHIENKYGTI